MPIGGATSGRGGAPIAITARGSWVTAAVTFGLAAPRSARRSGRLCSSGCRSPSASWPSTTEGCSRMLRLVRSRSCCVRRRSGRSAEALLAERQFPRRTRFRPDRFAAIEHYAYERMGTEHLIRLRCAVARIAAQLPVLSLPAASATVASGCALITADDARGRAVVARLLARYASSALVGTCVRESGG